jgi:hypothetical protein
MATPLMDAAFDLLGVTLYYAVSARRLRAEDGKTG